MINMQILATLLTANGRQRIQFYQMRSNKHNSKTRSQKVRKIKVVNFRGC